MTKGDATPPFRTRRHALTNDLLDVSEGPEPAREPPKIPGLPIGRNLPPSRHPHGGLDARALGSPSWGPFLPQGTLIIHERILAIDYGRVRHGLAVSDGLGLAAHPLPVLVRGTTEADLTRLRALIEDRDVRRVVLGLPIDMSGLEGHMAKEVRLFGAALQAALGLPLDYEDERLSTDEAEVRLKDRGLRPSDRKRRRDSMAAAIILEAVLAREQGGPGAG